MGQHHRSKEDSRDEAAEGSGLPLALRRLRRLVRRTTIYLDTVRLALHRPLNEREKQMLGAVGIDTGGKARRYRTPKHIRHAKRMLTLQLPTRQQLHLLRDMRLPHHLSRVDIALDMHVGEDWQALHLLAILARHVTQPMHRGHRCTAVTKRDKVRPEHYNAPSVYYDTDPNAERNGIVYARRRGKIASGPVCHAEARMTTKAACRKWTLDNVDALLDADLVRILAHEIGMSYVRDPAAAERYLLAQFEDQARSELGRLSKHHGAATGTDYPGRTIGELQQHEMRMLLHRIAHHPVIQKFDLGPLGHLAQIPPMILEELVPKFVYRQCATTSLIELVPYPSHTN